ncbi:MAG: M20/M25/M40 family metallo-hydrolase [Nitrospinaceae bacterium]
MREADTESIQKHLATLVGERNPYTTPVALERAGQYIAKQFETLGLRVMEESVPFGGMESTNVLGLKEGLGNSGDLFILAAHYDTVENSPGADDNASAVAAMLEAARCLESVQLKTPLLFAGFTLEEYGFVGSRYYIERSHRRKERFLGMISLEMVGFRNRLPGSQSYPPYVDPARYPDTGDFIVAVGNEPSTPLTLSLAEGMRKAAPGLPVETLVVPGRGDDFTEVRLSDHSPFWENGTPAVMVTDTAFFRNPNYHRPTDTLETLDVEFIRDVAQGIAGFLKQHLG